MRRLKFDFEKARDIMYDKRISQTRLARLLKVSIRTVNRWMNGKANPTLDNITLIADAIGIKDPRELLIGK